MHIEESNIEEILQRIDIVDIISPVVALKNAGRNLKGLCPFHNEKTPSFTVNRQKQMFHCFGCGASGDAISFIMKNEGFNFVDALKKLSAISGIEIRSNETEDPLAKKKTALFKINEAAADWFHVNLFNEFKGKTCRTYLKKRGLNSDTAKNFKLGFAPDEWTALTDYLKNLDFKDDLLVETGLCFISQKNGKIYDRFRNRVMFPIFNSSGRIAGFSGRILEGSKTQQDTGKYVNSPESVIFKKNQLLYGMYQAKEAITKKNNLILCEGHLDVCSLHQHGFNEAVGVQGTAFTEDHAAWITKHTKNVFVVFDGDSAGIKAALRTLPIALSHEMSCSMVSLPEGEDPASLLLSKGEEEFKKYLGKTVTLFDFKLNRLMGGAPLTPERKTSIVNEMFEDILHVKNSVLTDSLLQELSLKLSITPDSVLTEWRKRKGASSHFYPVRSQKQTPVSQVQAPKIPNAERDLIFLLLTCPDAHESIFDRLDFEWILTPLILELTDLIFSLHCDKLYSLAKISEHFKDRPEVIELLKKTGNFNVKDKINLAVTEVLKGIESNFYDYKIKELGNDLMKNPDKLQEITNQIKEFRDKKLKIKGK